GLRYLEHYAFRLVRESLAEREVLLRAAPHLVRPIRFVLPYHSGLRPWWLIRTGLFLYDHLGGREILPGTRTLDLRTDESGAPLRAEFVRGFEYSDCWVDDSRLVVLNARDAATRGADIRTRTCCIAARHTDGIWQLTLQNGVSEQARVLVNAAGPYVGRVAQHIVGEATPRRVRLVKGSHIVVPRVYTHDRSYIFQNADGRVCFAIPYERDFTLIGTTDQDWTGDPAQVACSPEEERYLCQAVSSYLRAPVDPASIVWRYAGVRPLLDDGASKAQEATRDYVLTLEHPALLSVFGGKITTYRRLAEAAMAKLAHLFPGMGNAWTAAAPLPGGDFPWDQVDQVSRELARRYPFLTESTCTRLVRAYGTAAFDLLGDARSLSDMGRSFGADLTEREVDWMVGHEWAASADDVLWRRSKLGLRLTNDEANTIDDWLAQSSSSNRMRLAAPSRSSY
ncbi:MAG TPA: glycerol-3-phosphate dehydrogenase, partial [Acetobacteraceae bacterium]|nr:glycerol-3-phosphate dehydrogenase [Acetobacteraceae bacterium]